MDDFFRFSKKIGFGVFLVHPTVVSVLLSASVERFFVSRMRDFCTNTWDFTHSDIPFSLQKSTVILFFYLPHLLPSKALTSGPEAAQEERAGRPGLLLTAWPTRLQGGWPGPAMNSRVIWI